MNEGQEWMPYDVLIEAVRKARKMVFFGGAGVSTESGIPDFRGTNGLYKKEYHGEVPPETILSKSYFLRHPKEFWAYYREYMIYPEAVPNAAHKVLAKWEKEGRLCSVVTQNIDGLHSLAGSQRIWELHGNVQRNYCMRCKKEFPLSYVINPIMDIPICDICGERVKPDVVLYEEPLDSEIFEGAYQDLTSRDLDLCIVGGTSLTVYPAASLIRYVPKDKLIILNKTKTPYDDFARIRYEDPIGKILLECDKSL